VTTTPGDRLGGELYELHARMDASIATESGADLESALATYVRAVEHLYTFYAQLLSRAERYLGWRSDPGSKRPTSFPDTSIVETQLRRMTLLAHHGSGPFARLAANLIGNASWDLSLWALTHGDLTALGMYLRLVRESSEHRGESEEEDAHTLAIRLENLADYYLATSVLDSLGLEVAAQGFEIWATVFSDALKYRVANAQVRSFGLLVNSLKEAGSHLGRDSHDVDPAQLGFRALYQNPLMSGRDIGELGVAVRAVTSALVVGGLGLVDLLQASGRLTETQAVALKGEAAAAFPSHVSWHGAAVADGSWASSAFHWTWWELEVWRYQRSGTLGFGRFALGALVQGDDSSRQIQRETVLRTVVTEGDARGASYLLSQLAGIAEARQLPNASSRYTRIKVDVDRQVIDLVAAEPLDPERIERFRAALVESWFTDDALIAATSDSVIEEAANSFGLNQLVQRDYFAPTEVSARPDNLGQLMGESMSRARWGRWLTIVTQHLPVEPVELGDSLVQRIQRTARDLHDPIVVAMNSYKAGLAAARALGAEIGGERDPLAEGPVIARYSPENDDSLIVVVERSSARLLRRVPSERPIGEGQRLSLPDENAICLLSEPTEEVVQRLAGESDDHDLDARVAELMSRVRVYIGEQVATSATSPVGRVFRIATDE